MSAWAKVSEFFGFSEDEGDVEGSPAEADKPPVLKSFKGSLIHSQNSQKFPASEIKVEEPRIYEDSLNIATHLRENKPVIVNLKYLDTDASKRLIDFICGTAYAINGHMMKIGENIFLFTPGHVLIADSGEKSTFEQGMQAEEKEVFFKRGSSL